MAKMTMGLVTYEGTPEELREVVRTFETVEVAEPVGSLAVLTTEKRHAKVGERILITDATLAGDYYVDGDVRTVSESNSGGVSVKEHSVGIYHREYEVIVEPTKAKLPADLITHKGVHYSLVPRKAQPGDVVVFTESGGKIFKTGTPYMVDAAGEIDGYDVYKEHLSRTESNVLVYEKVAKEAQRNYPQNGDIVRAKRVVGDKEVIYGEIANDNVDNYGNYGVNSFVDGQYRAVHGDSIEFIARAADRVDTK